MDFRTRTLTALQATRSSARPHNALVGMDGFVDTIVTPVDKRVGQGDAFSAIETITGFANRIAGAAGKSTNIEFYPQMDKLGGNGPIMANALLATDTRVTYIGALGNPAIHPVFHDFATRAEVISLCDPAITTAVEFKDGKLMLGQLRSLDSITLENIHRAMGPDVFKQRLRDADLIALVNWTMIPNMSGILRGLVEEVLPSTLIRPGTIFFFDLADPEKRPSQDLLEVLGLISRFEAFGRVTLGLNLKEAQRIHDELGFARRGESPDDLRGIAGDIRAKLAISCVVTHPRESAACATPDGTYWIPGPYTEAPRITTGAGDHFNAGFARGQLLGLDPEACLTLGVSTSGHYVRTAQSPSLEALAEFLETWTEPL